MRVGSISKGRRYANRDAGFTITELLVVVMIVGILAAIVYPVYVKATETAKISQCLSNMKQIGAGFQMYLDDYQSRYPAAAPWGRPSYWQQPANGDQKTIQELLAPYVRETLVQDTDGMYQQPGVFCCPSDCGVPESEAANGVIPGKPVWKCTGCSYEYYSANQVDWQAFDPKDPRMQGKHWTGLSPEIESPEGLERIGAPQWAVVNQSRKAVMGDTWYWHMGDTVPVAQLAYRNTLFADWHAQRVNGEDHEAARLQPLKRWHSLSEVPEQ